MLLKKNSSESLPRDKCFQKANSRVSLTLFNRPQYSNPSLADAHPRDARGSLAAARGQRSGDGERPRVGDGHL